MTSSDDLAPVKVARKSIEVNNIKLFYLDTETPGPCIFCLHGRFGRGETWTGLMRRYAENFRVIAPDQRGHGLSGKPHGKYTADEMASDAALLIEKICDSTAIVVGHSMGGRIAGYLAAMHPEIVHAVAILDQTAAGPKDPSALPLSDLPPTDSFTADWPLPFSTYDEASEFLLKRTQSKIRTDYYLDSLIEREDGYHLMFSQQATSAIFEYQQDWFPLLSQIVQPTLIIRAKDSAELTTDDLARMEELLPDVTVHEVSSPEHHVYLSDPDEFYRVFDNFVAPFC